MMTSLRPKQRLGLAATTLIAALSMLRGVTAQDPAGQDDSPAFDVASVRPNTSGDFDRMELGVEPGGRFTATNVSLHQLIRLAHGVSDFQLVGAPNWTRSERFDIVARTEHELKPGAAPPQLRRLLADRFALRVHREMRESDIYALVLARRDGQLGPALRRSERDFCTSAGRVGQPAAPPPPSERPRCAFRVGAGTMLAASMSMATLASRLTAPTGRLVRDRTGLDGVFDFDLTWTPDQAAPNPNADAVSIFTALQEQLGLRLESQRAPIDVLVVDRVERPTPN